MAKNKIETTLDDEVKEETPVVVEDKKEVGASKNEVEAKIRKQIEKKQEKEANFGINRIFEYLKEEHQWENWLFLFISIVTLVIGGLLLNGALVIRSDFPLFGENPLVLTWILVGAGALGLLYALYPFLKPAFPEIKKITWLTMPKFLGNIVRTFVFISIFTGLFILYNDLCTEIFALILKH